MRGLAADYPQGYNEIMFIYLDNSSTTKQYEQVTEEMLSLMRDDFGNPSSMHRLGITAENKIKEARRALAKTLQTREEEIYFTGGGTEADNTAIFGLARKRRRRGNRIITSKVEHPAVLQTCRYLEQTGFNVDYINVDSMGMVDIEELEAKLDGSVILVTIMHVNNEVGSIQPLEQIGSLAKKYDNLVFHTDAVQSMGKVPLDIKSLGVDMLSVSGHKVHGPKGVGALYIRKGLHIEPFLYGGGQESGFRSGTENVPAVAGFGKAVQIMDETKGERIAAMKTARERLLSGIKEEISHIRVNGFEDHRSSSAILNISFLGCRGEVLVHSLEEKGIFVSTGSACSSKTKGSHVLAAMGLKEDEIEGAIRFSFNEWNTTQEMDYVVASLKEIVTRMRKLTRFR